MGQAPKAQLLADFMEQIQLDISSVCFGPFLAVRNFSFSLGLGAPDLFSTIRTICQLLPVEKAATMKLTS